MSAPNGQLRSIIERIERLEEDKKAVSDDIKEVYAEAKANGFDTKVLREVIKLRRLSTDERSELQSLIDTYMASLGMSPTGEQDDEEAE